MSVGTILAITGAVLSAILCGIGSILGVSISGHAAAGVLSEKPELFGKVFVIEALPGTQGIYGFITAIMVMLQTGLLGGSPEQLTTKVGIAYLGACLPIIVAGLCSGIYQGRAAASAILMVSKQPDAAGKGITMTALVETYAILALLVSILLILNVA